MIRLSGQSGADGGRSSMLPALFGILLAIVFWMFAESTRESLQAVEMQVGVAQRTASRTTGSVEAGKLQASLETARARKSELTARLRTTETAQMIRAKIVYDLRQKCASTGAAVCSVRLADDTIAAAATARSGSTAPVGQPAAADAAEANKIKLIDLGIQKARAIISGSFQKDEVVELSKRLHADPDAYWRINGVMIRGTTFEFDVERHIITAPAPGS